MLTIFSVFWAVPSQAANYVSDEQVREPVKALPGGEVDLSGRDMSSDDFIDLDLTDAKASRVSATRPAHPAQVASGTAPRKSRLPTARPL